MCLATPLKITQINNKQAVVALPACREKTVDISLVPSAKVGNWLFCHADLAINIIKEKEAKDVLRLIKLCHHS